MKLKKWREKNCRQYRRCQQRRHRLNCLDAAIFEYQALPASRRAIFTRPAVARRWRRRQLPYPVIYRQSGSEEWPARRRAAGSVRRCSLPTKSSPGAPPGRTGAGGAEHGAACQGASSVTVGPRAVQELLHTASPPVSHCSSVVDS